MPRIVDVGENSIVYEDSQGRLVRETKVIERIRVPIRVEVEVDDYTSGGEGEYDEMPPTPRAEFYSDDPDFVIQVTETGPGTYNIVAVPKDGVKVAKLDG